PEAIGTAPAAIAAPEFALAATTEAAPMIAMPAPPAIEAAPAPVLAETIATIPAATGPEFTLEAAAEANAPAAASLEPAELVPAASLAHIGLLPTPAAMAPAASGAAEEANADSPWTVSEVAFPFEPSIEFVGAGIGLA